MPNRKTEGTQNCLAVGSEGRRKRRPDKIHRRTAEENRAVAYHEAGHAVVLVYYRLGFNEISISQNAESDSEGHVLHPTPMMYSDCTGKRERRVVARQLIIGAYAGLAAHRLVQPDAPDYHGASDEENAFWLSRAYGVHPRRLSFIGDDRHWEYLARLQKEAHHLVLRLQVPIARLADELLSRSTLTGAEVEAVVAPLITKD